jgi:hypothetical protein
LKNSDDVRSILPPLPTPFTAKDFSKATALRKRKSYYALKYLSMAGIVQKTGKEKNAFLYEIR